MSETYINPDHEGETHYEDPGLEEIASRESNSPETSDSVDLSDSNSATDKEQGSLGQMQGDTLGAGFTGKGKKKVRFSGARRRIALSLGGLSFVLGIGGLAVSTPLLEAGQLIHASELLSTHFASENDVNDSRIVQLYRYMFAKGTSKCNGGSCIVKDGGVGDTRLNWVERRLKVSTLKELKSVGIELWTDRAGNYRGMVIDTKNNPRFSGYSKEQMTTALEREFGVKKASISQISDGKFAIKDKGLTNFSQRRLFKFALSSAGYPPSSAMTWWRRWNLQKFTATGFHPFRAIDRKITTSVSKAFEEFKKDRATKLRGANNPENITIDTSSASLEEADSNGKVTQTKPTGSGTTEVSPAEISKGFSSAAKGTIGGAGAAISVVGLSCMAREVYLGASDINFIRNQLPAMNLAAEFISGGQQAEASSDITDLNLDFSNEILESRENGKVSSFFDAKSIRERNGQDGGVDLTAEQKALLANSGRGPSYLAWTTEGQVGEALKTVCGEAGSVVIGVAGIAVGIMSGAIVGTVIGGIAGMALGPQVISFLSNTLSGKVLDAANATGVSAGQAADFGAFMYSNLSSIQGMGIPLSTAEASAQNQQYMVAQRKTFDSKSLSYKLFAWKDKDSMAGKLIDNSSTSVTGNMAKISSGFVTIGRSMLSNFSSLISPVSAQSSTTYSYGSPKIGYTTAEINTIKAGYDPYENAYKAATILDADSSGAYINRALVCNGRKIYKDPNYGWSATLAEGANQNGISNAEAPLRDALSNRLDPMCYKDDANWFVIRNFVSDMDTLEGMACYKGVEADTTCANSGMDSSSGAGTLSTTTATDSQTDTTDALGPATLKRAQGSWGGYTNGKIPLTALTKVSDIVSSDGTKTSFDGCSTWMSEPYLNPSAAVSLVELNKAYKDKFGKNLKLLSCYRSYDQQVAARKKYGSNAATPGTSNHGWGLAIDFDSMSSYSLAEYEWLLSNAPKYGWVNPKNMQKGGSGPHEPWHWEYSRPIKTGSAT